MKLCLGLDIDLECSGGRKNGVTYKAGQAAKFLNGDWGEPDVAHYCMGPECCRSSGEALRKAVIYVFDLLTAHKPAIPLPTRWGQQIPGCAWWLLGGLVHDIIPRAFSLSDAEFGRSTRLSP